VYDGRVVGLRLSVRQSRRTEISRIFESGGGSGSDGDEDLFLSYWYGGREGRDSLERLLYELLVDLRSFDDIGVWEGEASRS